METGLDIDELTSEARENAASGQDLVLKLEQFEGPIDFLLSLAREQKVDLAKISILALAQQYLDFINEARALRLELAADYLVMAAWLAWLKSRLLLPQPPKAEEPSAEELGEALAFQLKRLEAMQAATEKLKALPQEGRDFTTRGMREPDIRRVVPVYYLSLYDLLKAVKAPLQRTAQGNYRIAPTRLFSIEESFDRMQKILGYIPNWSELSVFLPDEWEDLQGVEGNETILASALASTFSASLELVRQGHIELRQEGVFGPIYLRPVPKSETSQPPETTN
ncbi:MAG TPA: ScpA family protein [Alphaproteobacteria bacterium]|nr:ScpA family protein [Alphaproteobacteria bacterium]